MSYRIYEETKQSDYSSGLFAKFYYPQYKVNCTFLFWKRKKTKWSFMQTRGIKKRTASFTSIEEAEEFLREAIKRIAQSKTVNNDPPRIHEFKG